MSSPTASLPADDQESRATLERIVRILRFVIGAMLIAVVVNGTIIMVVFAPQPPAPNAPEPAGATLSPYLGLALIAPLIPAFFFLPALLFKAARRHVIKDTWNSDLFQKSQRGPAPRNQTEYLASTFQTVTILQCALCEGAAFLLLIWGMLSKSPWLWAIAAVMLGLLVSRFPSVPRLVSWIEGQQSLILEERQLAD